MTAKEFFIDRFNSCYIKKHNDSVFYIFNPQILRQKKLCRIIGDELNFDLIDNSLSDVFLEVSDEDLVIIVNRNILDILKKEYHYSIGVSRVLIAEWLNVDLEFGEYVDKSVDIKSLNGIDFKKYQNNGQYQVFYDFCNFDRERLNLI